MLPPSSANTEEGGLPFKEDVYQEHAPEVPAQSDMHKTETRSPSLAVTEIDSGPPAASPEKSKRKPQQKEYLPEEIPEEYREKPQFPYSHLIATALRAHPEASGISLSEIYKSIQEIFPFYQYCPHGWKHSVRHNLSSNKAFRKISKEGKGWLWGIDEEYFQERERLKKKAAIKAKAKPKQEIKLEPEQPGPSISTDSVESKHNLPPQPDTRMESDQQVPPAELSEALPPIKKEKSKTIAELAREIRIEGSNERLYRPAYSEASAAPVPATSHSHPPLAVATTSIAQNDAILNTPQYKQYYPSPMPPIPPSISTPPTRPPIVKSLADGQNTFRMSQVPITSGNAASSQSQLQKQTSVPQMRVNPQVPDSIKSLPAPASTPPIKPGPEQLSAQPASSTTESNAAQPVTSSETKSKSASISQLNLPKNTVRLLALLQEKIKAQMASAGQPINSAVLTNALAVAITQLTKGSGGKGSGGTAALATLLKGKNQAQLINAIAAAAAKKPGPSKKPDAPPDAVPEVVDKEESQTEVEIKLSSEGPSHPAPKSVSPTPTLPTDQKLADVTPTTAFKEPNPASLGLGTAAGKPKAAVIAEMLSKASKLTNPSPSIRAALVQLQAHATKLGLKIPDNLANLESADKSSSSRGLKRSAEEVVGTEDFKVKAQKTDGGA